MKKIITAGVSTLALIAGVLVSAAPAHAAIRVPKTTWPVCGSSSGTYCVEGVSVTTARGQQVPLIWVADGQDIPAQKDGVQFGPLIEVDKATNKVINNSWWTDQSQILTFTDPKLQWMDVTNLINTSNYPQIGAIYDSSKGVFDVTERLEYWSSQCEQIINNVPTVGVMKDCVKGALIQLIDNKVVGLWQYRNAIDAAYSLKRYSSQIKVDGSALAKQKLQPALGATYDAISKTFSSTEPLVVPTWITEQALINNWTVAGLERIAPETSTVIAATVTAGRALQGRWTSPNWQALGLGSLGYDGLFIDAKTANEFVNHLFIDTLPTLTDSSKKVSLAGQASNNKYAANLDSDITISIRLRTGEIKAGVTVGIGTDVTADFRANNNYSSLVLTGNPVTVPLAAKSADCSGESGIAKANVRQFQAILFLNNDGQSAFGAEGTSGDMVVSSNGVCDLSTPVWNAEAKEFSWTAAAPHFAADGVTPNLGFYKAIIPAADAKLLWGLENPNDAVKALSIQVSTTENGSSAALATIGVKNGKIIIDVSGFGYSRPKLKIALKKGWKPATSMLNKTTITCTLGKSVKKITAVKPNCPKGYIKK